MILLFSIVGLIVQPKFKSMSKGELENVRIITKSTNANVGFILNELKADRERMFILSDILKALPTKNSFTDNIISSPNQMYLRMSNDPNHKGIENYALEIIGDGFTNQQIKSMNKFTGNSFQRIIYESPRHKNSGIIEPTWDNRINLGEYSLFTAKVQLGNLIRTENIDNEKLFVVRLLNPSGQLEQDKKVIDGELISFRIVPKTFGLMTYKIEVLEGDKLISQENVAIEVTNHASLKMLILQSSPSFEIKQLKNWAGDNQAIVVVNTSINPKINISRLTNVEEINRTKYKLMTISESVLEDFDVLIIDSRRFNQLSVAHKKAITNSIDDGLGVIWLAGKDSLESTLPFSESDKGSFIINKTGKDNQSILFIETINGTNKTDRHLASELPISHIANSFQFENNRGEKGLSNKKLTPLITNSKKQILVAQLNIGLGKVSYSLLKDTYRWVSNGDQVGHSQLWQHLIKTTARNRKDSVGLINNSKRLVVGNKERLCVSTDLIESELHPSEIRSLSDNSFFQILFNKIQILENRYCASFWAETYGWHQMKIGKGNKEQYISFYIYPKENWIADSQKSKIISTSHYKDEINNRNTTMMSKSTIRFRKVELWIYWMLIISSLSFIWIERKYTD
ncbi:MAG: hypothetical protein COA86_07105 [Kangiella sp.]|nr:MAG: hypothetical protein COA86_07105 [Kangiella sp.]